LAKPAEADAAASAATLPDTVREAVKAIDLKVTLSKPMLQDLIAQYMQGQGLEVQEAASEASDQVGSLAGMAEMLNIGKNDGDNIVGTFHYADGTANLNGQAIPADELFDNLLGGLVADDASEADEPAGQMLGAVDPTIIGGILDETGISYETDVSETGMPFIRIDAAHTGASSVRVEFNDCDEASSCSDLMLRAVVASARPIPLTRINDWNTRNRWPRAYLEGSKNAGRGMDVSAYGGIGGNGASYLLSTFLTTLPAFAEVMTAKWRHAIPLADGMTFLKTPACPAGVFLGLLLHCATLAADHAGQLHFRTAHGSPQPRLVPVFQAAGRARRRGPARPARPSRAAAGAGPLRIPRRRPPPAVRGQQPGLLPVSPPAAGPGRAPCRLRGTRRHHGRRQRRPHR